MTRALAAATVCGVLLWVALPTATTVAKLDLSEMVAQSALIVVGTAMSAEPVWVGRDLYTRYTIDVEETLFGTGTPRITVLAPGGVDRSRRIPVAMAVDGAPVFLPRERAILLLDRIATTGDHRIVGFNQGRFTLDAGTGDRVGVGAPTSPGRRGLDALRARLDRLIEQRRSGQPVPQVQAPGARR